MFYYYSSRGHGSVVFLAFVSTELALPICGTSLLRLTKKNQTNTRQGVTAMSRSRHVLFFCTSVTLLADDLCTALARPITAGGSSRASPASHCDVLTVI